MEALAVFWSGGAIVTWTPTVDVRLTGMVPSFGGEPIVVSSNPSIVPGDIVAQTGITDHLIFYCPRGNGFDRPFYPFTYAARGGESIYFSAGGSASMCLLYEVSAEIDHVV